MLDVLKALFWVIVAWLFRLLGLTEKRKQTRFVGAVTDKNGVPEKLTKAKQQSIEKLNEIVEQIQHTGTFTTEELDLIFMMTHIMAGLVDKLGVILRCDFQVLPDEKVQVNFLAEDMAAGQPVATVIRGVNTNVISIKDRPYLAKYINGLIQYQAEKDRVIDALRTQSNKGDDDDQDGRPDEDQTAS